MEALLDYEALVTGQFTDERKVNSHKRKDDEAVDDFVKFLLRPDNVRTYSWGTVVKDLSEHEYSTAKASTYNHKNNPMVEIPRTYHAKDK